MSKIRITREKFIQMYGVATLSKEYYDKSTEYYNELCNLIGVDDTSYHICDLLYSGDKTMTETKFKEKIALAGVEVESKKSKK